jgi:glycosyltransferase involved in cell wall biosynthesis
MYREHHIALVIPAYREQKLISNTLQNVPELFDRVYVVDDCSPDDQNRVILEMSKRDPRIMLLQHKVNQGPGGAIITGYRRASADGNDIVVVVGGDHQMDLGEVHRFLDPIVDGVADYTKGNRFFIEKLEETIQRMPKVRFFANWVITALTKIASGYFHVMDVVDGYTAISRRTIDLVDWSRAWKRYGYPMDFLIRLNAYGCTVVDVPRTSIYLPGERQSQIKGLSYFMRVTPMLARAFLWRLRFKYIYLDFHPLVFFYYLAFALLPTGLLLGSYLIIDKIFLGGAQVTAPKAILVSFFVISGFQFLLFAMLFDREQSVWKTSASKMYQRASSGLKTMSARKTTPVTQSSTH